MLKGLLSIHRLTSHLTLICAGVPFFPGASCLRYLKFAVNFLLPDVGVCARKSSYV